MCAGLLCNRAYGLEASGVPCNSTPRGCCLNFFPSGEIPQETWFLLGRTHTLENRRPVLLSWTGTMFEYLMPALWMRTYPNTLLERSRAAVVRVQQAYAAGKQVPWGISECAYFKTDQAGIYQYQSFGVPQLALHKPEHKRLVISPYSTFLALHVDPAGSPENLRQM